MCSVAKSCRISPLSLPPTLATALPFQKNNQAAVGRVSQWETEETNFEGLRVKVDEGNGSEGWLMNRMSLHEPIVIFNVESVRQA